MNERIPHPPTPAEEHPIFELKPAYRAHLGLMILGVLLLPAVGIGLLLLLRAWYLVAATRYRLTTQRLFAQKGLIAKDLEEVELFRVKDVTVRQGVLDRMLGVGTVTVLSTDDSAPRLDLAGIRRPVEVKEQVRGAFRAARQREGMRTGEFIPS